MSVRRDGCDECDGPRSLERAVASIAGWVLTCHLSSAVRWVGEAWESRSVVSCKRVDDGVVRDAVDGRLRFRGVALSVDEFC